MSRTNPKKMPAPRIISSQRDQSHEDVACSPEVRGSDGISDCQFFHASEKLIPVAADVDCTGCSAFSISTRAGASTTMLFATQLGHGTYARSESPTIPTKSAIATPDNLSGRYRFT